MNLLGLPTQFDPNDGTSAGPAFVPTDLDPNNQTRSDARRTYFDPYVGRSNFHVMTGQHVTRVITAGVSASIRVSNPTPGGNENGNGPSNGNNEGFGFGPEGSTPPLSGTDSRFNRRDDPDSSSLRVIGVEVSVPHHLMGNRLLMFKVCVQRFVTSTIGLCNEGSHHCCWRLTLCPTPSTVWVWSVCSTATIWHTDCP